MRGSESLCEATEGTVSDARGWLSVALGRPSSRVILDSTEESVGARSTTIESPPCLSPISEKTESLLSNVSQPPLNVDSVHRRLPLAPVPALVASELDLVEFDILEDRSSEMVVKSDER